MLVCAEVAGVEIHEGFEFAFPRDEPCVRVCSGAQLVGWTACRFRCELGLGHAMPITPTSTARGSVASRPRNQGFAHSQPRPPILISKCVLDERTDAGAYLYAAGLSWRSKIASIKSSDLRL